MDRDAECRSGPVWIESTISASLSACVDAHFYYGFCISVVDEYSCVFRICKALCMQFVRSVNAERSGQVIIIQGAITQS